MLDPRTFSPAAALAAFGESFVNGRKVLVLGNALSSLPPLVLDRGARLIHVCDPDPARAAQADARSRTSQVSFGGWGELPLALREGAFDVALIENLAAFDPVRTLREVHRLLGPRGVLIAAAPNRDGPRPLLEPALASSHELDYYTLYDSVANEMRYVRMLGQAPFVGYAVAEFSPEGEIEPVIDTAFLERGSEEPEFFLAFAADHRASFDSYALVQLPLANVLVEGASPKAEAELGRLTDLEHQHRRRIAELEGMLTRSTRPATTTLSLEHKLERQEAFIRELEARAATADARADAAEDELSDLRARHESSVTPPPSGPSPRELELEAELVASSSKVAELETTLADRTVRLEQTERRLAELLKTEEVEPGDDLGRLEEQLVERGHEVRRLQKDLREAERIGRELLRKAGDDPALLRQLAEAQADRLAAVWAAEALRAQVETSPAESR